MSKSDFWVNAILIFFILLHIIILIAGIITHKLLTYVSFLNVATGLILIIYWIQKQLRITQHIYETRELIFLGFEALIVAVSVYSIVLHFHTDRWLRVTQYLFYSVQFVCLLLLLLFMFFFKMNRLM